MLTVQQAHCRIPQGSRKGATASSQGNKQQALQPSSVPQTSRQQELHFTRMSQTAAGRVPASRKPVKKPRRALLMQAAPVLASWGRAQKSRFRDSQLLTVPMQNLF